MDTQTKIALAAALAGGYLLGRTKKGKLALSVATYLAGGRFDLEPRQLAAEGMRKLGEIPQVAELQDQLKGEVLDAGRKAVTAAANRGIGTLAEALRDRTASLGEKDEEEPEDEGPPRRGSSRKPTQPDRGSARRRQRSASAGSGSGGAAKEPARGKKTTAKKPAPKKAAPAKKSAARKQAPAKKAASSGRAAKKTSKRADRRR
ncbi:hypothetical protein AB0D12_35660 [Streptomyces sp. NPDC048479]|uniref:hypothetical protein n=1 Tax=Streptomyces sp. NPDC048479 TaxID=3154725 RepID=UPI0034400B5E